jgi:hypothetical protein
MKEVINQLNALIALKQAEIEETTKAIVLLRSICDHDFKPMGINHQMSEEHFECKICGKEEVRDA